MLNEEDYKARKAEDMAYAEDIIRQINADPRPGVYYKESRPITDLKHMIETSVELYGDHVAFYQKYDHKGKYQAITYNEMLRRMNAIGTALIDMGFAGERIAVAGPNSSEWAISYLAVVNGVGIVVPLDKELNESELEHQLQRAKVTCVIYSSAKLDRIFRSICKNGRTGVRQLIRMDAETDEDEVMSLLSVRERGLQLMEDGDRRYLDAQIDATAMSILLFTSGTTGKAKGVMLSHRNIAVDLMISPTVLKVNDWDIFFSVLPLHHTYECTSGFLIPMYKGAAIAYCEGLKYVTKNLQEAQPTMFLAVPAIFELMYKKIWKNIEKQGKAGTVRRLIKLNRVTKKIGLDLSKVFFKQIQAVFGGRMREVICGGAAIDPNILNGIRDFGINALQGYGLTECAPMGALNPDQDPKAESVGYPFPATQIKVVDPDENGIGEFWLKGGNVMLGYYEMPEETAEVLTDGWFHSGDLGYIDEDGYVIITGRKKNVIITKNGKNVFPEELEYLLCLHPLIAESMVYADENAEGDDTLIVAVVKPDQEEVEETFGKDADPETVEAAVWKEVDRINETQPFFKRIKKVIIRRRDFIKNTSNKIIRFSEDNKGA